MDREEQEKSPAVSSEDADNQPSASESSDTPAQTPASDEDGSQRVRGQEDARSELWFGQGTYTYS